MIGQKLYSRRIEMGFSMSELANRVGLDPMFIHMYEQGSTNPSLATLRRIAAELNTPLSYFLGDDETSVVEKSADRISIEIQDTGVRHELLVSKVHRGTDVYISHLPPEARDPKGMQTSFGEKCILVLKGNICLRLGPDSYELEIDESIYFDCSVPHYIVAGNEGAVIVTSVTPPIF